MGGVHLAVYPDPTNYSMWLALGGRGFDTGEHCATSNQRLPFLSFPSRAFPSGTLQCSFPLGRSLTYYSCYSTRARVHAPACTAWEYGTQAEIAAAVKASGVPRSEIFITTKIPGSLYGGCCGCPGAKAPGEFPPCKTSCHNVCFPASGHYTAEQVCSVHDHWH